MIFPIFWQPSFRLTEKLLGKLTDPVETTGLAFRMRRFARWLRLPAAYDPRSLQLLMNARIGEVKDSRIVASEMPAAAGITASKTRVFIGNFGGRKPVNSTASTGFMEQAMGIEPMPSAR
jgi:hypothetical protein